MDCDDRFTKAYQVAVLNYDGMPKGTLPRHSIKSWYEAAARKDALVNTFGLILYADRLD